jgi:hypothetical protein
MTKNVKFCEKNKNKVNELEHWFLSIKKSRSCFSLIFAAKTRIGFVQICYSLITAINFIEMNVNLS